MPAKLGKSGFSLSNTWLALSLTVLVYQSTASISEHKYINNIITTASGALLETMSQQTLKSPQSQPVSSTQLTTAVNASTALTPC